MDELWMNSRLSFFCFEQEGDHIGLTRKSNSALHFFINGIDQGKGKFRECFWDRAFSGVVCTSSSCLFVTRSPCI